MVKITNIFGDRYSGQAGKAGVFATWKGRQYRRSYVIPANPKSTSQVLWRSIFKCGLYATRHLGATLWENDFNRAIGQLPGFQSMMSIILLATDRVSRDLEEPPDTPLGNLYAPDVTFVTHGSVAGSITASWSGALGLNGTDDDVLNFFGIEVAGSAEGVRGALDWAATAVRSDLTMDITTGSSTTDWIAAVYFQGAGAAEGNLSRCQWHAVSSL